MRLERLTASDTSKVLAASHLFDALPDEAAARQYLSDDRNAFIIAYVGDQPAGFVTGTILRDVTTTRGQMFLYEIGVEAAFRRRGIGSALIAAIADLSRNVGCEEMFVLTNRSNVAAMRLYETTGGVTEAGDEQMFVYRFDPAHSS